ncbi:porin [Formosimonas limnophila]|uniref:Porin n=1 Tax=Formosimonas limnophila TaxID=1384487 RepID=A0A8J3CN20_9BURK|nr:porin [Formosimonas limnophila]GHA73462.1 porin [Formosimonas limnophila]
MKKSLVALAVLSSVVGVAQAASSVTLYGRVDIGYEKVSGSGSVVQERVNVFTGAGRSNSGNTRLGLRGEEDLGNGMAATFRLEGRFDTDTGSKDSSRTFFDRESTVGLKFGSGVHHVRFGRSISAFEQGISDIDIGNRFSAYSVYNENWGVATRHSNAMFYNFSKGPFSAGFDVTTKGGYNDGVSTAEGAPDSKVGWAAFAQYKANGLKVALAYQDDGAVDKSYSAAKATSGTTTLSSLASATIRKEWGIGASYEFKPVIVGLSYAQGKDDRANGESKVRNYGMYIKGDLTATDSLMALYRREDLKSTVVGTSSVASYKDQVTRYGLGYVHKFSKRTSVYADISRTKYDASKSSSYSYSKSFTGYDIALRHFF